MKETTDIKRNYSSEVEILTQAEQDTIVLASYFNQYGVLFRLALFSGLSVNELLGLQWDDLDPEHKLLHIRYVLCTSDKGYELCRKPVSRTRPQKILCNRQSMTV